VTRSLLYACGGQVPMYYSRFGHAFRD